MADEAGYGHSIALLTGLTTAVILIFGEIIPKTFQAARGQVRAGGDALCRAVRLPSVSAGLAVRAGSVGRAAGR